MSVFPYREKLLLYEFAIQPTNLSRAELVVTAGFAVSGHVPAEALTIMIEHFPSGAEEVLHYLGDQRL